MKKQGGFTLIEIAIVLVIIGLLLGGVLKGQELINSAKVKNFANDFRNIPLFIYGYQDKYKALPGDHRLVTTAVTGSTKATTPAVTSGTAAIACPSSDCTGNGVIDGTYKGPLTDETILFWQHVRMAGLAAGPTGVSGTTVTDFLPKNADGGLIGIENGNSAEGGAFITGMNSTYVICSEGILGKYAKQLDTTMDDGVHTTGSMRAVPFTHARNSAAEAAAIEDSSTYIVCLGL